jgi:SAM-dependent methyltransferase
MTTTDSEIDVQALMQEIRDAVAKREASENRSLIGASVELHKLLATTPEFSNSVEFPVITLLESPHLNPLKLQPEFTRAADRHYHVNDLLQYHDHIFVWNAYRALLKREPDEEGLREFLTKLRSGVFNKIDVLARLRYSPEGKTKNVRVDGLWLPATVRKLYRLPVVGYLLEIGVAIIRLPSQLRAQRQIESHVLAQMQLLADQINTVSEIGFNVAEPYSRELDQLAKKQKEFAEESTHHLNDISQEQRRLAEAQHQQIVAMFREHRELKEFMQKRGDELETRINGSLTPGQTPVAPQNDSSEPSKPDLDPLLASLADQCRGDSRNVKKSLELYVPFVKETAVNGNVLDLGCGRGDWLELLREEGIQARGVEHNRVLAAEARSKGLVVSEEDAVAHLRGLPDQHLSVVTAFHLIEHLPLDRLIELADEIHRTLKPGGRVIFETPNPKNLVVAACNFYSDPTHHKPLFPETLSSIMAHRGFTDIQVQYVNAVDGSPFTKETEESRALNSWFFSPRDFAVIARRN